MSLHFAAARKGAGASVARILTPPSLQSPANDDRDPALDHALVREALLHFAAHGLGAARAALAAAQAARAQGDAQGAEYWQALCRVLDPRLARTLDSGDPLRRLVGRRLGKR